MNKKERLVQFYDLRITAASRTYDAPVPISALRCFELISMVLPAERRKSFSSDSFEIYVSDFHLNLATGLVHILMNKCDKAISDPTFTVPSEGKRRTAAKTHEEGQDFAAHIVIKIDLTDSNAASLLLLEQCPGVTGTLVTKVLSSVLNRAQPLSPNDFVQVHPDGSVDAKGKQKTYNTKFAFVHSGHPSTELIQDIDEGKLQSIELVTENFVNSGFDSVAYMKETSESIILKPTKTEGGIISNWTKALNVFSKAKGKYGLARVRFKSKSGVINSVTLSTESATSDLYVKKVKIDGFRTSLKSSYEKFNPETITKMNLLV